MCVACLGLGLGAGASVFSRQFAQALELEAYTQAVLVAQELLELRRVKGRFPEAAELDRYRWRLGLHRSPTLQTREERLADTGLNRVTVAVAWRPAGAGPAARRTVKLASLTRRAR